MDDSKLSELPADSPAQSDSENNARNHATSSGIVLGGNEEKRLIRKLDLHIIPVVMMLYLLSFLDR